MENILAERDEVLQQYAHKWAIGLLDDFGYRFLVNLLDWQVTNKLEDLGIRVEEDCYVL